MRKLVACTRNSVRILRFKDQKTKKKERKKRNVVNEDLSKLTFKTQWKASPID
jgi:hypothetical protein